MRPIDGPSRAPRPLRRCWPRAGGGRAPEWLALLVAVAIVLLGSIAEASTAPARRCLAALEGIADDTAVDLAQRCPRVKPWLRERGYLRALRPPLESIERADRLRDALRLVGPASESAAAPTIDRGALERIVEEARRDDAQPAEATWWSRLKQWLRTQLAEAGWAEQPQWLKALVDALARLGQLALWLGYALAAIAAALLAWGLARWLHWYAPRGLARRRGRSWRSGPATAQPPDLETIRAMPQEQQPAALLRYTIAHLRRTGALPHRRGLTDRELVDVLRSADSAAATRFARIADCARRSLYANQPAPSETLERCVADARVLANADRAHR